MRQGQKCLSAHTFTETHSESHLIYTATGQNKRQLLFCFVFCGAVGFIRTLSVISLGRGWDPSPTGYLRVLFMSGGRMQLEIDRWMRVVSAVMQVLLWSVVVKKELSQKARLSIYGWSMFRLLPMVMKSFSPAGWLGSPLDKKLSHPWGSSGIWLKWLLDASFARCYGHVPLEGDLREDLEHAEETMSLS